MLSGSCSTACASTPMGLANKERESGRDIRDARLSPYAEPWERSESCAYPLRAELRRVRDDRRSSAKPPDERPSEPRRLRPLLAGRMPRLLPRLPVRADRPYGSIRAEPPPAERVVRGVGSRCTAAGAKPPRSKSSLGTGTGAPCPGSALRGEPCPRRGRRVGCACEATAGWSSLYFAPLSSSSSSERTVMLPLRPCPDCSGTVTVSGYDTPHQHRGVCIPGGLHHQPRQPRAPSALPASHGHAMPHRLGCVLGSLSPCPNSSGARAHALRTLKWTVKRRQVP